MAYQKEAFSLVLQEANKAAKELNLHEELPITETNLTEFHITGYGRTRIHAKPIGNVSTKDYCYYVSVDHRLSDIESVHQDQDALKWRVKYKWPLSRLDTNAPYQLATQWLAAVSMDVKGLNQNCEVRVILDQYWNNPKFGAKTFVPIYEVLWLSRQNRATGYCDVASVRLFLPTKTLMGLRVGESKYILRPPLVFTNLAELLSDTNVATKTYFPAPPSPPNLITNDNPN
jgi:hypothetical protein